MRTAETRKSATGILNKGTQDAWVIEPRQRGFSQLREPFRYAHLLKFFGSLAIERLYRRTVLGFTWVILKPLLNTVIGTIVFGNILGVETGKTPYFLYLMTSLLCWNVFAGYAIWATRSLEMFRRFLSKFYFPRIILPMAAAAPVLTELAVSASVLGLAFVYYLIADGTAYFHFELRLLAGLLCLGLSLGLALGIGLFTSVMAVGARDIRFTLVYLLGFWQILTPVLYPVDFVPQKWQWLMYLNPMTAIIENFKWSILGHGTFQGLPLFISFTTILLTLTAGLLFFYRKEAESMDRL